MKRILGLAVLVVIFAGLSFAQTSGGSSGRSRSAAAPEENTVAVPAIDPSPSVLRPAAKAAPSQRAPSTPSAPIIVQPIITNPPVVNHHYYGKVYNPPAQAQAPAQTPAPTTVIIPIPVPSTPAGIPAAPMAAQSPQAVPAVPSPTAPVSAGLPRRDPYTGYIIPAGPPRRTIRGILGVERGMVTLCDANEVRWFIMGLERYIGLIEGLNIGEDAEIIGYAPAASSAAQERFFQPLTLILEGAEYDIGPLSAATRAGAFSRAAPQAQTVQPAQTVQQPLQTVPGQPGTVQAGGVQYLPIQPIIIQPAPPPREEKYVPWVHVHTSPWSPHYGAVGQDIDTSSFWNQKDDVWW